MFFFFFFSSRRRHTRCGRDWSSDVCSSDLGASRSGDGRVPRRLAELVRQPGRRARRMRAGRREWVGLGVLALPCLLYSMDLTVLYMAVPKLSADLHPSSVQLLWITDIYGFMLAEIGRAHV